jgi:hypothetical protein
MTAAIPLFPLVCGGHRPPLHSWNARFAEVSERAEDIEFQRLSAESRYGLAATFNLWR